MDKSGGRREEAQDIRVFYANSRSVINKIDTLRAVACTEEFDIIGITETWLEISGKHFLPEVEIDGYTLFHKDREGRKGGGVAIYVKNTVNSYVNTTIRTDRNTESLWVEVITGGKKVVVGIIYRPPDLDGEANTALIREIERASRYDNVCIMGDFNYREKTGIV